MKSNTYVIQVDRFHLRTITITHGRTWYGRKWRRIKSIMFTPNYEPIQMRVTQKQALQSLVNQRKYEALWKMRRAIL